VAPSSIPKQGGKAVKTDRIDAAQPAQFYASDQLTIVQSTELGVEQDRDLLRSRQCLMHQREQVRRHRQAILRRNGLHYKAETQHKSHWTKVHHSWLERTIATQPGSRKVNLELQYRQSQDINRSLAEYNQQIEALAQTERYQKLVQALICYKGIKTIFALTMIVVMVIWMRTPFDKTRPRERSETSYQRRRSPQGHNPHKGVVINPSLPPSGSEIL